MVPTIIIKYRIDTAGENSYKICANTSEIRVLVIDEDENEVYDFDTRKKDLNVEVVPNQQLEKIINDL